MRATIRATAYLALLVAAPLPAQVAETPSKLTAPPNSETDAIATKFLALLKTGGGAAASAYVASLSPLFASRQSDLQLMSSQIDGATQIYGPVVSWVHIESEVLGPDVRRDFYTVQHSKNVVRWRLYFTRTPKGWAIASFNFDDQVQTWF